MGELRLPYAMARSVPRFRKMADSSAHPGV